MHRLILTKPNPLKTVLSFLIDVALLIVVTIPLYFVCLYGFFNIDNSYNAAKEEKKNIEIQHGLVLDEDDSWEEYEQVVKNFYTYYQDIIEEMNPGFTYIHVYNVAVLGLPLNPTHSNFENEFFKYDSDESGFKVDEYGINLGGSGPNFNRYMLGIFRGEYKDLFSYLKTFDKNYADSCDKVIISENFSRLIAFVIAIVPFYWILPFIFKHGATLGEKMMKLGKVNSTNGVSVNKIKLIFTPIILYLIPALGVFYGTSHSLIILSVGPLAISFFLILLGKRNVDLADRLLRIELVDTKESEIPLRKEDIHEELESQEIEDPDYLSKLSNLDTLNVLPVEEKQNKSK